MKIFMNFIKLKLRCNGTLKDELNDRQFTGPGTARKHLMLSRIKRKEKANFFDDE